MKLKWILALLLLTTSAWGNTPRALDGAVITNGSGTLTLPGPGVTDTLMGRATVDTVTNKLISGSSNTISNLSGSSITSGTSSVSVGGTGVNSIPSGAVVTGAGTGPVTTVSPGTSGNVLQSTGSAWVSATPTVPAPSLTGTAGAGQALTSGTPIIVSSPTYSNIVWALGTGGSTTIAATPSVAITGFATGADVTILGTDNTNTFTLQDETSLPGSKLQLNGNWLSSKYSALHLKYDGTYFVEVGRR